MYPAQGLGTLLSGKLHHQMRRLQGSQALEKTEGSVNENRDAGTRAATHSGLAFRVLSGIIEWMGHVMTTGQSHDTGSEATATILVKGAWLPPGCWRLYTP